MLLYFDRICNSSLRLFSYRIPFLNWVKKMENKLILKIDNEDYPVKGDFDPDYMKALAEYINNKITLLKNNQYLPHQRLGMIVALNIADDYFKLKKDYDELLKLLEDK